MRGLLIATAFAVLAAGTALSTAPAGAADMLALHPKIWASYQTYLDERWPGAFAVSRDGTAHGSGICPAVQCALAEAKRAALRACRESGGADCVIFAVRDEIRLDYRVLTREEASICPLAPAPKIRVSFSAGEPGFDHGRTVAYLTEQLAEDERHWLDEGGTVMGLTEHSFVTKRHAVGHVTVAGRDGASCAGFADGEIRLELDATIYVAREIPEETCLYREVLTHERRHQALGVEMTQAYARELEATIAAVLADEPFVEVPAGKRPWQVAAARLDGLIDEAYAVFRREHSRRQLAIDSQEEYERADIVCPGETDKYLP